MCAASNPAEAFPLTSGKSSPMRMREDLSERGLLLTFVTYMTQHQTQRLLLHDVFARPLDQVPILVVLKTRQLPADNEVIPSPPECRAVN